VDNPRCTILPLAIQHVVQRELVLHCSLIG
jgi:hypothetical protein